MGIYDSIYARCNVDWIDDARCKRLPNAEARWLNHLYWMMSVKEKRSVLPERYTPEFFAELSGLSIQKVHDYTIAMAVEELIAWTPDGLLVVFGTAENHARMKWRDTIPRDIVNPYRTSKGWGAVINSPAHIGDKQSAPLPTPTPQENREGAAIPAPTRPTQRAPKRGGTPERIGSIDMARFTQSGAVEAMAEQFCRASGSSTPEWRAWWEWVATTVAEHPDSLPILDALDYVNQCADATARRTKGLGELENPTGYLIDAIMTWCRARNIRWPRRPDREVARITR